MACRPTIEPGRLCGRAFRLVPRFGTRIHTGQVSVDQATAGMLLILLAQDDRVNTMVPTRMLERLGCAMTAVGHGRDSIDALRREVFDLVLMDCQLPVMGGHEATRIVRASADTTRAPIRALTASAMSGHR